MTCRSSGGFERRSEAADAGEEMDRPVRRSCSSGTTLGLDGMCALRPPVASRFINSIYCTTPEGSGIVRQ